MGATMAGAREQEREAGQSASAASDLLASTEAGRAAIRGGAVRVLAFGATVLVGVGSSALLYRHLKVADTGHYMTIVVLVTLCGGLTDAGLSAIGVRELATRDAAGRYALMRSLGGLRLALALAGVLIAVAFAIVAGYGRTLVIGAVIAGAGMLLVVLQDTYAITLTARLRITWLAGAELLRALVMLIAIVILVVAGAGLLPFYAATIPAGIVAVALTAWLVRGEMPLVPSVQLGEWRALFRHTISFSLATAVIAVYFRVAIVVVSLLTNPHQTGYFAVSFRVIEVLISVPVLLVGVAFPIFARAASNDPARLRYAVGRAFDTLWLLGLAIAIALFVGAPIIIRIVAGPLFGPSEAVLRIQGLALIASFVSAVWGYTLLSLHRYRQILIASLVALALTVGLTATLSSLDGARGAAIATAVCEFALMGMLAFAVYSSGLRPAITFSALRRSLLAAALAAATLAIPGLADAARLALALVIYGVALLVLGAVPKEILAELPWRRRSDARPLASASPPSHSANER